MSLLPITQTHVIKIILNYFKQGKCFTIPDVEIGRVRGANRSLALILQNTAIFKILFMLNASYVIQVI